MPAGLAADARRLFGDRSGKSTGNSPDAEPTNVDSDVG
jgi:hypothetical protein